MRFMKSLKSRKMLEPYALKAVASKGASGLRNSETDRKS